jgi:hypothetical protein
MRAAVVGVCLALAAVVLGKAVDAQDATWATTAARIARARIDQSPGWKIATDAQLFGDVFAREIAEAARTFSGPRFERAVPADHQPSISAVLEKFGNSGTPPTASGSHQHSWRVERLDRQVYFYEYGRFGFGVLRYDAPHDPTNKVVWVAVEGPGSWGTAVDRYRASLRPSIESPSHGAWIEEAFALVRGVDDALTRSYDGKWSVLEWLSQEDYDRLAHDLQGLRVNRMETVYVKPDPAFFLDLAVRHGRPADKMFFAEFRRTFPEAHPHESYITPQTDYSGCIAFERGELVRAYGAWQGFRRAFPGYYESTVSGFLQDIEDKVGDGVCACGDATTVTRELSSFLGTFPASPVADKVKKRLAHVGPWFSCQSCRVRAERL